MGRISKTRTSSLGSRAGALGLMATAASLVGLLGVAVHQGCSIYDPSLLQRDDADVSNVPLDGGYVCSHAHEPDKPDADSDFDFQIIAAMNTIDLGTGGADAVDGGVASFGYDLDGVCTCPGPPSCQQQNKKCDDSQGRDNASLTFFGVLGRFTAAGTGEVNQGLQAGLNGLLLSIQHYNAQADDSTVSVSFYLSNGLPPGADGGPTPPRQDGNDSWTIDPHSLRGPADALLGRNCGDGDAGCLPVSYDNAAWVTDHKVVAHFSTLPLSFGTHSFFGGATILLNDAVLVGTLSQDPQVTNSFELTDGIIGGRWPTSQLLSTLAFIPDGLVEGAFLCGGDTTYQTMKKLVCGNADIFMSKSEDGNPNATCDAVSVGLAFTAKPAKLGVVRAVSAAPSGCQSDAGAFSDCCGCATQP